MTKTASGGGSGQCKIDVYYTVDTLSNRGSRYQVCYGLLKYRKRTMNIEKEMKIRDTQMNMIPANFENKEGWKEAVIAVIDSRYYERLEEKEQLMDQKRILHDMIISRIDLANFQAGEDLALKLYMKYDELYTQA